MTDLDAIRARAEAATPGPWRDELVVETDVAFCDVDGFSFLEGVPTCESDEQNAANVEFIAHAREDIPALLVIVDKQAAKIDRLTAEVERLRSADPLLYPVDGHTRS